MWSSWDRFMKLFAGDFTDKCYKLWNPCIWLVERKFVGENHRQVASWNAPLMAWFKAFPFSHQLSCASERQCALCKHSCLELQVVMPRHTESGSGDSPASYYGTPNWSQIVLWHNRYQTYGCNIIKSIDDFGQNHEVETISEKSNCGELVLKQN